MTENLGEILNHSNGYQDSKPLVFPKKDLLDSNGYDGTKDSLGCETKDSNELQNVLELDDSVFFEDISRNNEHEMRAKLLENYLNEGLSNLTSCKRNGNPFACDTEDRDHLWSIPDFVDDEEKGAIVSNAQLASLSDLFGTDTHFLYTDKGVVECKLPESTICYKKGSDYYVMKDICMDEGTPLTDKLVTESRKDDQSDSSTKNTREDVDNEYISAGESKDSSVESTFRIPVDYHTTKEDEDTKLLVPHGLNPFLEDNMSKDANKDSYLEDAMKTSGSKCTTRAKPNSISEKESDIQNSKESNSDAHQSAQQPDQMPSSLAAFNSHIAVSAADETNNKGPASNFLNNSKSEAGPITCDFNLTEPALRSSAAKTIKNLPESSLKLEAVSTQRDENSDSFSAASQVHFANNVDANNSGVHGHFADGEASFSAAVPASGLITCSGPIPHSANVSLRSDSSTTSARSFAFPVLQSEWNSSPVRMAQAERRKHRGWRQSLLCCKF